MYKLVAIDIDGTLLNEKGELTCRTERAVRHVIGKGVMVVLSTGRPLVGIASYCERLGIRGPVITYNGASVVDVSCGRELFSRTMDETDARCVFEWGRARKTTVCLWSKGALYASELTPEAHDYAAISGIEPRLVSDAARFDFGAVTKMLWCDTEENVVEHRRFAKAGDLPQTTVCTSRPTLLEFFNSSVSKAEALRVVGREHGIASNEMMAIGDGENDVPMLVYAGLGVAMGNASDEVKGHADATTLSCAQDGVAAALERHVAL